MLPSSQRERRVSRLNRTGKNTTGWARRLTALLVTACLVMAMALPVYAEVDLLPDALDEVELLEDEQGTASGEDTTPPEQNAATPEPEQSAEPEQPAPTETPEPTAEPALTPEPTEQPQMDAEEAEDMDGALKVSTQSNQFTVYFAVPSSWEVTKNSTITFNAQRGNGGGEYDGEIGEQPMSLVPDKITSKGQRIYKIILTNGDQTICPWGGYVWMQFTLDESHKVRVTAPPEENNTASHFVKVEVFNDKYYDGDANSENGDVAWNNANWADALALPDPAAHTAFGDQKMVFENLSDSNLANVTAVFTEQDSSGKTTETETVTIGDVAKDKKQGFEIPTSACSSVQFFAENGSKQLSESYNFYEQGTDENTFLYNASKKYCFTYKVNNQSTWGTPQGKQGKQVIYFDATFSWLSYENEKNETHNGAIGCGMPTNDGKLWCYLTGDGKAPKTKQEMNRLEDTNIWYYEVPEGYTKIRFASWAVENEKAADNGDGTAMMDIPADLSEPCFFADASDDVIYNGGNRGGYWAEKGTPRDAKEGKKLTDVVDISKATFKEEADTKYVSSTLYDYYTDYELNGNNRDNYNSTYYTPGEGGGFASQRSWVTFRQFDRALSDYYSNCKAQYPIYTGHFQPTYSNWGITFETISAALNLWGFNKDFENKNRFMAINNSTINEDGSGTRYDYAYQGLVKDKTSTGDATGEPLLKDTTTTVEPHFNKEFLSGTNTKNAKLGDVYDNVAFPFTKRQIFDEDQGVDYWYFDSQDTTLYLKQDSTTEQYFLKSSTENRERSRNLDSNSAQKSINKNGQSVSSYGYFPFNETATAGRASTYNYGFGTKLQMDFTLTDDGKVETNKIVGEKKEKTSIKFFFSGDDDVWVFIDGKLALDVGGAHGKVSGLLEFGETTENGKEKNSVTAYVSKVKTGGTSKSDQNGNSVKSVRYNGEPISFSAQGTTLTFDKGQKHTLTMYYMERGMWESNMAVAFNFPDNNELKVQKIVDTTDVNDWFKSCFDTPDLFAFNIKNQATHYQNPKQDATIDSDVKLIKLNTSDYASYKPATKNNKGNIFELTTAPNGEKALHWYAQYQDTNPPSRCRSERYGILTLNHAIDISQMRYLTFDIYAKSESGQGELSLGNLYLELLDNNGKQKGCLDKTCLNGTTYGTVTLANDKWITVKLDLYKLNAVEGFDPKQVTTIRVGDNYPRHIYFKDFVFSAQAKATTKTGFTTKQEDIPVYGSIKAKDLTNAAGAQFTTTKNNDTQVVDENGQFMLQNGETVTFSDQFRRGSYISLKETLNPNLYDTTWTVFENDEAVQSYGSGNTVKGDTKNLNGQAATESQPGPDDGRTEVYNPTPDIANDGYTKDKKPDANTIVFRSYKDPDENTSSLTKLKVQFVNKVKTGDLVIKKAAASGEEGSIQGEYTFNVTFTNVGDEGLEQETIEKQVTINMKTEDHCEISGIPIGTRFRIEEVKTNDGSHLQGVSVTGGGVDTQVVGNTYVQGSISGSGTNVTATFTNTKHELINIDFTKTWKNANGDLLEDGLPDKIYIQLQRRKTESETWKPVKYPDANSPEYVMVTPTSKGWDYPFANLDKFDVTDRTNYQYRIVEGTVDNSNFTEVNPNETITIKGNTYVVTAKAEAKISDGDSTKDTQATALDGTITGGSGKIELTNKLQNPKFALDIIKKDAEKDENDKDVPLGGVEFKLEKLVEPTTEGEPQKVDTTYIFNGTNGTNTGSITATTNGSGEITNMFTDLEPGTYRLTETKAHPGYNLLAQPIKIKFTQDGKCYIDDVEVKKDDKTFIPGANNTYTMTLTVLNRKTPELPHTGADAPSLWLLIGMPLAVAGLLIFTFRYNRKGGRRH